MKVFVGAGRLLCKPEEAAEMVGEIVIPDSAKEAMKSMKAEVVQSTVEGYKKGDTVYFGKFAGIEVDVEDTNYLVIAADEVLLKTTGS